MKLRTGSNQGSLRQEKKKKRGETHRQIIELWMMVFSGRFGWGGVMSGISLRVDNQVASYKKSSYIFSTVQPVHAMPVKLMLFFFFCGCCLETALQGFPSLKKGDRKGACLHLCPPVQVLGKRPHLSDSGPHPL